MSPVSDEQEAAEEGLAAEAEGNAAHTNASKPQHTIPSHPWCHRNKVVLIIAVSLLTIVGVILGVVLTRNNASGEGAAVSSTFGDALSGSWGGESPHSSPAGETGSKESDERPVPSPVAPPPQSGQLTAADIDDNLNFVHFLAYKKRMLDASGQERNYQLPNPDLSDRITVSVVDEKGVPFSSAHIESSLQQAMTARIDNSVMSSSTNLIAGTNGKFYLFPALDGISNAPFSVRAKAPSGVCPDNCGEFAEVSGTEKSVTLVVPGLSSLPSQMDLALVVDTTGSMCDELSYLQSELSEVLSRVTAEASQNVDIRVALVAYRDHGDKYVVSTIPFDTPERTIASLMTFSCGGGGDYPEAMDEALEAAATRLQWRKGNVARVLFLVADAPPHTEKLQAALNAALQLRQLGVKVYGLAASGVADTAEYEMRLMGVTTGARYMWLTDDSGIGKLHAVPKVMCYQVTRLDHLLVRVLRSELKGERVEAQQGEIVREVGSQKNGTCVNQLCTDC